MQQRCAARIAARLVHVEPEARARIELRAPAFESAQPQLGPLQVEQHADGPAELRLEPADGVEPARMVMLRAVAEVEPEHIHTAFEQGTNGRLVGGGGAQRGHDLRAACTSHHPFHFIDHSAHMLRKIAQPQWC